MGQYSDEFEDEGGRRGRRGGGNATERILSPGEYVYVQDTTSGVVSTHVGPIVVNLGGSARAIRFDPEGRSFEECSLSEAVQSNIFTPQGSYLVLENPVQKNDNDEVIDGAGNTGGDEYPKARKDSQAPTLQMGKKVNIPNLGSVALWPQQIGKVIQGHDLRSDQYLRIRVYDEELAKANWDQAITKKAEVDGEEEGDGVAVVDQQADDLNLSVGSLFHIKGTEVSFYIPPTGVEVVPTEGGEYVRDALTLEMAEQCILIDQKGKKRCEKGPAVVFPEPTEEFYEEDGKIKFPPIELNHLQGLHLKANCDFTDEAWVQLDDDGEVQTTTKEFVEGEEVFITGETHPMYFPREEFSIVRYGDTMIHYATCIPEGEGRYVMDRKTGVIETRKGPSMMLLNPITHVMVRRVLSDQESELMYPGNADSLDYNRKLRAMLGTQPSARSGFVSEGDYQRSTGEELVAAGAVVDFALEDSHRSRRSRSMKAAVPDEFRRKTEYTKPHAITLGGNTKFDGVPKLIIWTGYAVLVVKANGDRRVEVGPKTILLDFDETIEPIHLSKGTPKSPDTLIRTGYLRVVNNKVSDLIQGVETKDNIKVDIALSYRVTFDPEKRDDWFDVENYVQFLVEHGRSIQKGLVKGFSIEEFYDNSVAIVRDNILGKQDAEGNRPLKKFTENGMTITDVEVLGTPIQDHNIAQLLTTAQHETIQGNIDIDRAKKRLEVTKEQEAVAQETEQAKFETDALKHELRVKRIALALKVALDEFESKQKQEAEALKVAEAEEAVAQVHHDADLSRDAAKEKLRQEGQEADTKAVTDKLSAAQNGLAEAILALSNQETLAKVAEATSIQTLIGGKNIAEVLGQIFQGSPLEGAFENVTKRGAFTGIGNDQ
jgi:major vault protein